MFAYYYVILKKGLRPLILKRFHKRVLKIKILKESSEIPNRTTLGENKSDTKGSLYKSFQNSATKDTEN